MLYFTIFCSLICILFMFQSLSDEDSFKKMSSTKDVMEKTQELLSSLVERWVWCFASWCGLFMLVPLNLTFYLNKLGCTKMAGSLKPSGSPSVDTQRPTSGSVGRAGSVQSPTTQDRRSPLVSPDAEISHLHELRAAYIDTLSRFPLTIKIKCI